MSFQQGYYKSQAARTYATLLGKYTGRAVSAKLKADYAKNLSTHICINRWFIRITTSTLKSASLSSYMKFYKIQPSHKHIQALQAVTV